MIACVWCLQLDLWYVILNGAVEIGYPDGRTEILCMGNSFGISPSLDKQYMNGEVRTKGDDSQVKKASRDLKQRLIFKSATNNFCGLCSCFSTHSRNVCSHCLVPLLTALFAVFT